MKKCCVLFFALIASYLLAAQQDSAVWKQYQSEQRAIGRSFSNYFYPRYATLYSLPEKEFIVKIDSARALFDELLHKYSNQLDKSLVDDETISIKYYFDKLIIDYPSNYETYAGKPLEPSPLITRLIEKNLPDLNNPELLTNSDLREYVKAFLYFYENAAHKKGQYQHSDNQHLEAAWDLISKWITQEECAETWKYEYLRNHIENYGIKNIGRFYRDFKDICTNIEYYNNITAMHKADSIGRQGHMIRTYKTVGSFKLDMHIFLSDSIRYNQKRPVIVYFHGGSWSEGKPDWFFDVCKWYAKQGWMACAVEYRVSNRHGSLPFQSVMDARSAIRWIRQHANEFNIDTSKIIASGNSAGGHLVLCTALADKWNEETDDLSFSPVPNVLLVNAGVFDLTDDRTAWIRKGLKDKNTVKEISPNHLVKPNMPPTLLIHGTNDGSVPFETAKVFEQEMKKAGNNFEFHALKDAPHFIWYQRPYSADVSFLRAEFLKKLEY
ncbi:MAG TPA: alpha/beta hydrolase [Chitinophagaceae bacterium]|nr:alpha/beta hydrolase [Chitinophagaceae bacterium]